LKSDRVERLVTLLFRRDSLPNPKKSGLSHEC
jgi:hypothetical protein